MTAVNSRVLRYGRYNTVAATGDIYGYGDEVDIWGHVHRDGWHILREITVGKYGEPKDSGRTWTKGGAWVEATAAAFHPGIDKAVAT